MAKRSNTLFDGLAGGSREAATPRKRGVGLLEQRDSELSDLAKGNIEDKVQRWVDPARCRMWDRHNRRYDLLTESRCQDLIDGFKSQGRQEFPAIVRRTTDDPNFEYEVICGARRHWVVSWLRENNYPEFQFLVEVRTLTDEQAFRLSDIENRDKEDLSDYERALDYKAALGLYYKNQKEMATRLEVSEAWLSRYLDLASLPLSVVDAFGDLTAIAVKHGRDLKPLLRDRKATALVESRANTLAEEQRIRRENGKPLMPGAAVVAALSERRPRKVTARGEVARYETDSGTAYLTVTRQGRSGLVLRVVPGSGADKATVLAACEKALDEFF